MNMFMYKNKRLILFDSLEKYFSIFCNNGNKESDFIIITNYL